MTQQLKVHMSHRTGELSLVHSTHVRCIANAVPSVLGES